MIEKPQQNFLAMRTNTETYPGLPIDWNNIAPTIQNGARRYMPLPMPKAQPPLVSISQTGLGKVSMDTTVHIRSGWPQQRGKALTNRRIAELQREGRYGSGLKLPPLDNAKPCCECKTKVNTRQCDYAYLPKCGVYCAGCRTKHREVMLKAKDELKREKELFKQEYV